MNTKRGALTLGLATLGVAGLVYWQLQRLFTEEPDYALERRVGPLEIRRYGAIVQAETDVDAPDWRVALDLGFRRLAAYIFGRNHALERVSMTTPVKHGAQRAERLPMTAPVARTASLEGPWRIAFTMPAGRSLTSLPEPDDARVHLTEIPERRVAVLRFNGRYSAERVAAMADALREEARTSGLVTKGEVEFAGYDPPSTLPFLRRNEVWVELAS